MENLFNSARPESPPHPKEVNEKGLEIAKNEVKHVIKLPKNSRATGPDNTHTETLKLMNSEDGVGLNVIFQPNLMSWQNTFILTEVHFCHSAQETQCICRIS